MMHSPAGIDALQQLALHALSVQCTSEQLLSDATQMCRLQV